MKKDIQLELLQELIGYVGNKLYTQITWFNFIEKVKQRIILRFLQQTYRNIFY